MIDFEDKMIKKGTAYEEMINSPGWESLKEYINEQVKSFADMSLTTGFKSLEEYQFIRGQAIGLQNLINEVESSITHLNNWRETKRSGEDTNNANSASNL